MKKYDTLIFDLDGTLAVSKRPIDSLMAELLSQATHILNIVIITGGRFSQIEKQVINQLTTTVNLENFYILPTSGSSMRRYNVNTKEWDLIYENVIDINDREYITKSIFNALEQVTSFTIKPEELVGDQIEDRDGTQITLSALGQQQPIEVKQHWDQDQKKRRELVTFLTHLQDKFDVKIGGTTSVDITLKGIDKAFGINQFYAETNLNIKNGLFVGDQIVPGGNDYAATTTGIDTQSTTGPEQTMAIIHEVLGTHD